MLNQTSGTLDSHLGNSLVVLRCLIKSGIKNLNVITDNCFAYIGNLLRTLIDQHDDNVHLRIVPKDGTRDILQKSRFSCLRRRYDQASLPLSDRCEEINDPHRDLAAGTFHSQALIRKDRCHAFKVIPFRGLGRCITIDQLDKQERGKFLLLCMYTGIPAHDIPCFQAELPDLGRRNVHIILTRKIVVGTDKSIPVRHHLQHAADFIAGVQLLQFHRRTILIRPVCQILRALLARLRIRLIHLPPGHRSGRPQDAGR